MLVALILALGSPAPTFETPAELESHDGSVLLAWEELEADTADYEVEQRDDAAPGSTRVVYRGRLPSAHVSGLLPGAYRFRLRARDGSGEWTEWSAPVAVDVRYHPMWAVLTSLGLGALVFFATAGFVITRTRGEEASS